MDWQELKARPARTVSVCLQTPEVVEIAANHCHWFILGAQSEDSEQLQAQAGTSEPFEEGICRSLGDAAVIKVSSREGEPDLVEFWKGLSSGYDLYVSAASDSKLIASDNYADLVAQISPGERHVAPHAPIDHMLFRTVPGEETYLVNVYRIGHGTHVRFECQTGHFVQRQYHKITDQAVNASYSQMIDLVDDGLEKVLGKECGNSNTAGLFSGGVDSTLNQSYLGKSNGAINLVPPALSDEWTFQAKYASQTAKQLGIDLLELPVFRENMLDQMSDMTRRVGLPLRDYNMGMYIPAFLHDWNRYVIGERADALFGAVGTRIIKLLDTAPPIVLNPTTALFAATAGGRIQLRAQQINTARNQLRRALDDPWGYGALMSCFGYADFEFLKEIFGAATVTDRLASRSAYVRERMEPTGSLSPEMKHLEFAHWVDYFCEDGAIRIRQLAHSFAKTLICPYLSGPVVRSALGVHANERFIRGLNTKHLLKAVLKKRVPNYPTKRRKGITGVRLKDHYPNGDLAVLWEDAPIPEFLPSTYAAELRRYPLHGPLGPGSQGWNLVAWALWTKHVLHNDELQPHGQIWMF